MIRKLNRGIELFGHYRLFWTDRNWRSKPNPFWFFAKYPSGDWSFQSMRFEIWKRV